jgi:hypothetical protein
MINPHRRGWCIYAGGNLMYLTPLCEHMTYTRDHCLDNKVETLSSMVNQSYVNNYNSFLVITTFKGERSEIDIDYIQCNGQTYMYVPVTKGVRFLFHFKCTQWTVFVTGGI